MLHSKYLSITLPICHNSLTLHTVKKVQHSTFLTRVRRLDYEHSNQFSCRTDPPTEVG